LSAWSLALHVSSARPHVCGCGVLHSSPSTFLQGTETRCPFVIWLLCRVIPMSACCAQDSCSCYYCLLCFERMTHAMPRHGCTQAELARSPKQLADSARHISAEMARRSYESIEASALACVICRLERGRDLCRRIGRMCRSAFCSDINQEINTVI
jgi:hypothetical protein